MADYGTDVTTQYQNEDGERDLDPFFGQISGPRAVSEGVVRAWESDPGELDWDPGVGFGLLRLASARTSSSKLLEARSALAAQAERDERVYAAEVEIAATGDAITPRLRITGEIVGALGPFELVAQVTDVSVELLRAG